MRQTMIVMAVAALLTACGGGDNAVVQATADGDLRPTATQTQVNDDGMVMVQPREATAQLNDYGDEDVGVMPANAMTPQQAVRTAGSNSSFGMTPQQVRQRYGFTNMDSAANQGSGQVIAIVAAYHNPNIVNDLARFSQRHGLPGCTTVGTEYRAIGNTGRFQPIVTQPQPGDGCTFQVVNLDSFGRGSFGTSGCTNRQPARPPREAPTRTSPPMCEILPPVDRTGTWIVESTLDVQWAHAIAPRAKIVLIQVPTNFAGALSYGVQFASTVAGTVSMSWGALERAFRTPQLTYVPRPGEFSAGGFDHIAFARPNVSYVAASGDWGYLNLWPASSPRVLTVGGTTASGTEDTGWSGSGGGVSQHFTAPAWQSNLGRVGRSFPDVAYNADPRTAYSIYVTPQPGVPDTNCVRQNGADQCGWYGAYGTSVGAPQWAGIIAIARARRAELGRANIDYNQAIYAIANNPALYSQAFADVTVGNNGATAGAGFDLVTGFGVPRARQLIDLLVAM